MFKFIAIFTLLFSQQAAFAGSVTWYNQRGRMANGKTMNPYSFTAAHRTIKLGSIKTICYKNHCVKVKITDRCNCNGYDLTPAAFRKLNPLRKGRLNNVKIH